MDLELFGLISLEIEVVLFHMFMLFFFNLVQLIRLYVLFDNISLVFLGFLIVVSSNSIVCLFVGFFIDIMECLTWHDKVT